jgi:polygalacturonase
MRGSFLYGIIGSALLSLASSAGAIVVAGNPCSPLVHGAIGDGTVGTNNGTLNTGAIQAAIDACAARGGGIVALSPVPGSRNVFLTGPIQLKSHVYLQINAGVTLLGTTDQGQYSIAFLNYPMPGTNVPPFMPTPPYEALIFAFQAVDTGIIGLGTINGQGNVISTSTNRPAGTGVKGFAAGPIDPVNNHSYVDDVPVGTNGIGGPTQKYCWWSPPAPATYTCPPFPPPAGTGVTLNGTTWYTAPQTDIPTSNGPARPWLIEFYQCGNVTVNGVTLSNSPMWNLVLRSSSYVTVSNLHIINYSDPFGMTTNAGIGTNTDGIDPVGSSFVTISNIDVQVGDDDVAIKSGLPLNVASGSPVPPPGDPNVAGLPTMPSHDITVANSNITGGHGISIGSEASNGVFNVLIQNINANGSSLTEGLRLKTGRTRGSFNPGIHDITINNMVATNVVQPILIYDYYPASGPPNEQNTTTLCTATVTNNCIDQSQPIGATTPNVYNITINGLTATGATQQGIIAGVPEACINNVVMSNVSITTSTATPTIGNGTFLLRNMTGTFTNVNLFSSHLPAIPAWVVQENVIASESGGTLFPGNVTSVNTPPLPLNPTGVPCHPALPPG